MKRWMQIGMGITLLTALCGCAQTGADVPPEQALTQSTQYMDVEEYDGEAFPMQLPKEYQPCKEQVLELARQKQPMEQGDVRFVSYGGEVDVDGTEGALLDVYQMLTISSGDQEYLLLCSVAVCPDDMGMEYYWYDNETQNVKKIEN